MNPEIQDCKIWLEETRNKMEISFCNMMRSIFQYLGTIWVWLTSVRHRQTDGPTLS